MHLTAKELGMIQDAAEAAAQFLNAYHARQFVESSCDQNLIDELMFACKEIQLSIAAIHADMDEREAEDNYERDPYAELRHSQYERL